MLDDHQQQFVKLLAHIQLEFHHPQRSLPLLQGLLALVPDDPETLKMLAWAQIQLHQYQEALDTCDRYLTSTSQGREHAPIRLLQARALWGLGKQGEARKLLDGYLLGPQP